MDFEELDAKHLNTTRYEQRLTQAKIYNYKFVSEAIVDMYYNLGYSSRKISNKFNAKSQLWIFQFFKGIGLVARPTGARLYKIYAADNFEIIDKKINFKEIENKLETAKKIGCSYVSEAIVELYYNRYATLKDIGIRFNQSDTWVLKILKKINMQKKNTRLSEDVKKKIKDDLRNVSLTWETIREYLEVNQISISPKTVQRLLKEKTFENVGI